MRIGYRTQRSQGVNSVPVTIRILPMAPAILTVLAGLAVMTCSKSAYADESAHASGATERASKLTADRRDVLDGWVLWLGPTLAWQWRNGDGDSLVGAELTLTQVRQGCAVALLGASLGAARFAERDAGRIWAVAAIGTRWPFGVMAGATAGPVVELAELARPKVGGAAGVWVALGVVPFARVALLADGTASAELGLELALPLRRW